MAGNSFSFSKLLSVSSHLSHLNPYLLSLSFWFLSSFLFPICPCLVLAMPFFYMEGDGSGIKDQWWWWWRWTWNMEWRTRRKEEEQADLDLYSCLLIGGGGGLKGGGVVEWWWSGLWADSACSSHACTADFCTHTHRPPTCLPQGHLHCCCMPACLPGGGGEGHLSSLSLCLSPNMYCHHSLLVSLSSLSPGNFWMGLVGWGSNNSLSSAPTCLFYVVR